MKYKKYPKYKDSGVEWLGEIPNEWTNAKLKFYLNELIAGGTPKTDNIEFWAEFNEGIPWVSIADMTKNDLISETKKNVTYKGISEKNLKILPKGTLLYSIFASLGKVATAGVPLTTNQAILGIVPNHKIDKNYLYWLLIGLENYVKFSANSNTQDNLNSEKVANFPISVPLLNDQQQIANFLDNTTAKIDTLIEKQTKQIELLKEKRQAVISHAVTKGINPNVKMKDSGVEWLGEIPEHWEVKKLKYISTVNNESLSENFNEDFEINYIDIGSVTTGNINKFETMMYSSAPSRARRIVKNGDILISTVRTYLKAIAPISSTEDNFIVSTGFAVIRPNSMVISAFMKYGLISNYFIDLVEASSVGISYPAINSSDLITFKIVIPPLEEQQQIANYLDDKTSKMDKLIEKANKSIELLKEKRTALISAAVTGKIDVRELV